MYWRIDQISGSEPETLLKHIALICVIALTVSPSVSASNIGAKHVRVTDDYVSSSGVCSCSLYEGNYHIKATFKNYCPNCHHKGSLAFEQGDYKGSDYTSPEGLWYCTRCDMDFCLVHGKEHVNHNAYWLVRTTIPKPKINKTVQQVPQEHYVTYNLNGMPIRLSHSKLSTMMDTISNKWVAV